jgi:hypothetical protein
MKKPVFTTWMVYSVPILGLIVLFAYASTANLRNSIIQATAVFFLQAAAALAAGAVLGILFGMPRPAAGNSSNGQTVDTGRIGDIADWLTKLFVGISITQFYPFLRLLKHYTDEVARNLTVISNVSGGGVLLASILCYSAWGFLVAIVATHQYWQSKAGAGGPSGAAGDVVR